MTISQPRLLAPKKSHATQGDIKAGFAAKFTAVKVAQQAEGDQKVCINMLKKDQLSAIALMKRRQFFQVLVKMVAMATSHTLLRL